MPSATGLDILKDRISAIPFHLQEVFSNLSTGSSGTSAAGGTIATGLGSSEAAARYYVRLLYQAGNAPGEFVPLSVFYGESPSGNSNSRLVVFSQGLAPNSRIALERRSDYRSLTLVTSSTEEGQIQAGKPDRAQFLIRLKEEGATIVHHPLENEYEILPRVIGPVCSMAAALRMTVSEDQLQAVSPKIFSWFENPPIDAALVEELADDLIRGVDFYFTNRTSQYGQNLSAKCLETIFRPAPRIRDAFDYAHGPFQAEYQRPGARWIFTSTASAERDLVERLHPLFQRLGPARIIESPLPEPFAIFYYEALLNPVVLRAAEKIGADLINWPGKGEDGDGYTLAEPFHDGE